MALHDQTEQQPLENELRGAIDEIRGGNVLAFASFACRLYLARIEPHRIARAKASRNVSDEEFAVWETAYRALPQAERDDAEYPINLFVGAPGECLTFRIGPDEFGLDILRAREIRSYEAPTKITDAKPCILGVLNWHGVIIPIIDLRLMRGVTDPAYNTFTVTIIAATRDQEHTVGLVVDSVTDIVEIPRWNIQKIPPATESRLVTRIGERTINFFHLETAIAETLNLSQVPA